MIRVSSSVRMGMAVAGLYESQIFTDGRPRLAWRLVPDTDLIAHICEENNKDLPHMVGQ